MDRISSDIREDIPHNLQSRYPAANLKASNSDRVPRLLSFASSMANSTAHLNSLERVVIGTLPTRTATLTNSLARNDISHSFFDMFQGNLGRESSYNAPLPPPLSRIASVALPPLSPNIPIHIHALLMYRPSNASIYWNTSLPPSTAVISIIESDISRSGWPFNVAVVPTVSSITIRTRGVPRPIVVFPAEAGLAIRIADIMRAVYSAMRNEALDNEIGANDVPLYGRYRPGTQDPVFDDTITADAIQRHFHNCTWWNGLSESTNEVDVWVLHLRCPPSHKERQCS